MSVVYTVASSSTVVQDLHNHHTALGWIVRKCAEGFAQEYFIKFALVYASYHFLTIEVTMVRRALGGDHR